MSEQKSITVEQEVEAILTTQLAQYSAASTVLPSVIQGFYREVAQELQEVLDAYIEKTTPPTPVFKVGDHVLLTGAEWAEMGMLGTVVTVAKTDTSDQYLADPGDAVFEEDGAEWLVEPDPDSNWGGKVVDPEIRVGDTVRIREDAKTVGGMNIYMGRNQAGVEFEVTKVVHSPWTTRQGQEYKFYVYGDPEGNGVWDAFIEKVHA